MFFFGLRDLGIAGAPESADGRARVRCDFPKSETYNDVLYALKTGLFHVRGEPHQEALLEGDPAGGGQLGLREPPQRENGVRRGVVVHGQAQLLEVVDAPGSPGRLTGRLHGRQEQRDQDRDDRDHHQSSIRVKPRLGRFRGMDTLLTVDGWWPTTRHGRRVDRSGLLVNACKRWPKSTGRLVFRPSSIDGQRSPEFLEYPGLPVSRTCQSKIVGTLGGCPMNSSFFAVSPC